MNVTVVIPLYNKQNFVERAIQSLLSQNHQSWNAIVVDDGSEDNGPSLVTAFRDSRIRIIHQRNQGASAARNRGIAEADTEWVAFLDADDEYQPYFISSLTGFLSKNLDQNIVMISGNQRFSNTDNLLFSSELKTGIQSYFSLCNGNVTPVNSSNCLAQRAALLKTGGFPVGMKFFEDWTCWMKVAMIGNYAVVNEVLSIYHSDDLNSTTATKPSFIQADRDVNNLLVEGRNLLSNTEYPTEIRRELSSYLNRFIFRSAIPLLCHGGGGFSSMSLVLKKYNPRGFCVTDIRCILASIKMATTTEAKNTLPRIKAILLKTCKQQ